MAGDKYDKLFEGTKVKEPTQVPGDKYDALFDEPLKKKRTFRTAVGRKFRIPYPVIQWRWWYPGGW